MEPSEEQDRIRRSAECFNLTWDLLVRPERSKEEDAEMVRLAQESLEHWNHRADVTDRNRSIGHWLVSRACAVADRHAEAWEHGLQALEFAREDTPFYLGYAHEALARAAKGLRRQQAMEEHLKEARALAAQVQDAEQRLMLRGDLEWQGR